MTPERLTAIAQTAIKGTTVNTASYLKRIAAGALLSGVVAVAGFGLAAGAAQANTRGPISMVPRAAAAGE